MKLTKSQIKLHEESLAILTKDILNHSEKEFVFRNFHPGYENSLVKDGVYFTPSVIAWDAAAAMGTCGHGRILDACAGIGMLAYSVNQHEGQRCSLTCIEKNPRFVEIGKKLVPEAEWICGDIFEELPKLKRFDGAITNPPFGKISGNPSVKFKMDFHLAVVELLTKHTELGATMILPRLRAEVIELFNVQQAPWRIELGPFDEYTGFKETNIVTRIYDLSKDCR